MANQTQNKRRSLIGWIVVLNLLLGVPNALAGDVPPDVRATAEALYQEAYQLAQAGKHAEACKKLEESDRLDPATGTKMELAKCYEKTSRPASAWALYVTAADADKLAGKNKARETEARDRAAALFPELPRLVVIVPESIANLPDILVERDGVAIGKTLWSTAQTVDLGTHTIRVTAKGKLPWENKIATNAGATATLHGPDTLENDPAANTEPHSADNKIHGGRTLGTPALVGFGLGAASLVAGGVFGGLAFQQWGAVEDAAGTNCVDPVLYKDCSTKLRDMGARASTYATVSTVTFAVGGAAVATGIVLWLFSSSSHKTQASGVWVVPQVNAERAGFLALGRF